MTEAREMSTDYPLHVHELVEGKAMPEMVERVAEAIENAMQCRSCGALIRAEHPVSAPCCERPDWEMASLQNKARAAIEAMRNPSEAMLSAAANDPHAHEGFTIWRAMIDAALGGEMTEDHIGRAVPGWRGMDSAPMDARLIEVREAGGNWGRARRLGGRYLWEGYGNGRAKPVEWRVPLPDPPEVTG